MHKIENGGCVNLPRDVLALLGVVTQFADVGAVARPPNVGRFLASITMPKSLRSLWPNKTAYSIAGESRDSDRLTWSHIDDSLEGRALAARRGPKGLRRTAWS